MDTKKIEGYFNEAARLAGMCGKENSLLIGRIAEAIIACFEKGGQVLLCGNGGSASQCQHFAAELVNKLVSYRRALPAIALTADMSAVTSIGNDLDFSRVFSRQVEALGRPGDILWGLSTSGSSANVIEACRTAREAGLGTLCFTGPAGSALERLAGLALCVDSRDTARIQEIHLCSGHAVCALVEEHFLNKS